MSTQADTQYDPRDKSDRLVRFSTAQQLVGISRSKIYQLLAEGEFPTPVKLGRTNYFSHCEIQRWIELRLRNRVSDGTQ